MIPSLEQPHSQQSTASSGQVEPEIADDNETELLTVSWNQNYGRFAFGTNNGFQIYNCDSLTEAFRRDFKDLKLVHQLETLSNPKGLYCLSHHSNTLVLTCPGIRRGEVRVEHLCLKMKKFISAHDSQIACMTLSLNGLLLATASTKGTLIRIFNANDGTRLQEVRRGLDRADVYSISFSPNAQWLAVSSDKGTVHVFSLRVRAAGRDASTQLVAAQIPGNVQQNALISAKSGGNTNSSFYFMKGVLPNYFSSEWSSAQFHLPEETYHIAAFDAQDTVMIIGMDGRYCSYLIL
ncbi:hypothetical protein OPV22_026422 [Ensete ventricosum]|uniref:BCAS3 domain-containing protein n=1 Tax=Ensete ventricosum TaxID=4639 RepID=A0AAV8Q6F4_ENSVE|nr:hypothetical protein OPV22_026422 [Ensete ventricosum]